MFVTCRMSSSELFHSPKGSFGYVSESSSSSVGAAPLSPAGISLFEDTSSSHFNQGLYNNYSQWFRNESSPYHKDKNNICGLECSVVNPSNRNPLDTSDLECKENLDTGSSFFNMCKSMNEGISDNDSNELLRFNDVFRNRVNVLANASLYVENDKAPDAQLEQPLGRPGLEHVKNNPSPVISKTVTGQSFVVGARPVSRRRAKPGKQFFVTVTFDFSLSVADKLVFLTNINVINNPLVSYCVAVEHCERSETGVGHIHSFVEFTESLYILELCEYLRCVHDNCHIDVQPCRSKKSCLKYITKSDVNIVTNIRIRMMHFNYQCYVWASNVVKFDCTDPFVVAHRFQYKFLERYRVD